MSDKEFYIGTVGPLIMDDTDPLWDDPGQLISKERLESYSAPIESGVTGGDSHDHSGGDGAQIDHGGLGGLTDDDHTQYAFRSGKIKFTSDGGIAVLLTNRTGAASVKGYVVTASDAYDNAVKLIVQNIPDPIGVFLDSDVADGAEAWVVTEGIADVYFVGDTTRSHIARGFLTTDSGYVTGQALSEAYPTSPFASDKHFYEIGHVLESRVGAGLAKVKLHMN